MTCIKLFRDTDGLAHMETDLSVFIILDVQKETAMHLKAFECIC